MKLFNIPVIILVIILLMGCEKPREKSAGELYQEAVTLLTDLEKGDPDKALENLNKAITLDPDFIEAYLTRAEAYMSIGEQEKAFEDFNKAIQLDPNSADIYYTRGKVYSDLKQHEKAFEDFNQAIRLKPNFADVYFEIQTTQKQHFTSMKSGPSWTKPRIKAKVKNPGPEGQSLVSPHRGVV